MRRFLSIATLGILSGTLLAEPPKPPVSPSWEEHLREAHRNKKQRPSHQRFVTHYVLVPRDFLARLDGSLAYEDDESDTRDPFDTTSRPAVRKADKQASADLVDLFVKAGVAFPEGASASYNRAFSLLTYTNTPTNVDIIQGIVEAMSYEPPIVFNLTLELFEYQKKPLDKTLVETITGKQPVHVLNLKSSPSGKLSYFSSSLNLDLMLGLLWGGDLLELQLKLNSPATFIPLGRPYRRPATRVTYLNSKINKRFIARIRVTRRKDHTYWPDEAKRFANITPSPKEAQINAYPTWASDTLPKDRQESGLPSFIDQAHYAPVKHKATKPQIEQIVSTYAVDDTKSKNWTDLTPLFKDAPFPLAKDDWVVYIPEKQFVVVNGSRYLQDLVLYLTSTSLNENIRYAAAHQQMQQRVYTVSKDQWKPPFEAVLANIKPDQEITAKSFDGFSNYFSHRKGEYDDETERPIGTFEYLNAEIGSICGSASQNHGLTQTVLFQTDSYSYFINQVTSTTAGQPHYQVLGQSADGKSHHILVTTTTFVDANGRSVFEPRTLKRK